MLVINLYGAIASIVALVQLGLTSALIFLVDRHRRAYLWFAIQLLSAAYYPASVLGITQIVFGIYDIPVLAVSIIAAVVASIYFTHEFFDLAPPWPIWRWLGLGAAAGSAVASGPFTATRYAGLITVTVMVVLTGYQLVVCIRLAFRHPDRVSARLQLAAWLALASLMPVDLYQWAGLGAPLAGARPASLGLFLFVLFLSAILSRRHILTLRREAELVVAATARRAELEALNVELRHQVAERSSQLFSVLALASGRKEGAIGLSVGAVVQARYRVIEELGRGGMGTVYEVERLGDGCHFALKQTHDQGSLAMARLAREAVIASRVDHRNVVRVIDVGVDTGFVYVVMELVAGTSLRAHRGFYGTTPWALDALSQIASGLAALHAVGVIHRDLKPANVLVTETEPRVFKITDFGVSRPGDDSQDSYTARAVAQPGEHAKAAIDATATPGDDVTRPLEQDEDVTAQLGSQRKQPPRARGGAVTKTGMLVGTPPYMAPEAGIFGREPSSNQDIFAFGVIAFELLTGTRPHARPPAMAVLAGEPPPVAPSLATRWDRHLDVVEIIDRCLALNPPSRPTAAELARAFEPYRQSV